MSDSNLSEKLVEKVTEGITNIIKKTIIFEKTERMTALFIGLAISTSVFGLFTMYNSYQLNIIDEKVSNIAEEATNIENIVKENAHIPRVCYRILLEDYNVLYKVKGHQNDTDQRINKLHKKIDKIIAILEDKKETEFKEE
jgi:hypothetical protein